MRVILLLIAAGLLLVEWAGVGKHAAATLAAVPVSTQSSAKPRVDFETQLKPIFQSKCMPCHFSGGKVYDRMPFDNPATIKRLGTKLFTRIKEEHERGLIEDFLSQTP